MSKQAGGYFMKKNNSNDCYVIGIDWLAVIVLSIVLIGSYYLLNRQSQPSLPWNRVSVLHIIVVLLFLLSSLKCYVLDNQGFSIRIFNIQLKRISWNQIGEVILVRKKKNSALSAADGILLVTPLNCEPFKIGVDKVDRYVFRHTFSAYSISIYSRKQANDIAAAFEKYYGSIIDLDTHK